jgi:AcrR family transcriptional regulator
MINNDNSVNIKNPRAAYHHGDLRTAVVVEGLRMLETSAAETISLREVARNVGVSAPAVYRHFPDKSAFLKALAAEGMRRLARDQAVAQSHAGGEGFAASGRAYVRFGIGNPGLFRLIFASGLGGEHDLGSDPEGSAGWMLRENVAAMMGGGADPQQSRVLAYRAWALVHGLTLLILDNQINHDEGIALIDRIVSADSIQK